jgi:metal-responsive CopG/Arc/MetJ family transcriptional regulator
MVNRLGNKEEKRISMSVSIKKNIQNDFDEMAAEEGKTRAFKFVELVTPLIKKWRESKVKK